ncbi:hypothetical protein LEP1GSC024_4110 [Leptospira noguchii str. 2001034031]|uniref:Uncharacterized protein n=1 Tax=Leptospira noguchii str. 2001034031 TaxID=1193053 RepID=M6Y385_9LEPT|nr:hypothetical protein LEP1GSC024_4110 [Leptospira noguchii str. 2001034031]
MKNSEGIGSKRTQQNAFYESVGNSVNAYLRVGVQGVVAPEFIIHPNFLTSNSR